MIITYVLVAFVLILIAFACGDYVGEKRGHAQGYEKGQFDGRKELARQHAERVAKLEETHAAELRRAGSADATLERMAGHAKPTKHK